MNVQLQYRIISFMNLDDKKHIGNIMLVSKNWMREVKKKSSLYHRYWMAESKGNEQIFLELTTSCDCHSCYSHSECITGKVKVNSYTETVMDIIHGTFYGLEIKMGAGWMEVQEELTDERVRKIMPVLINLADLARRDHLWFYVTCATYSSTIPLAKTFDIDFSKWDSNIIHPWTIVDDNCWI
jgi:hypothetical protein